MGRLTNLTSELKPSELSIKETVEIMRRTIDALNGASEIPVTRVKVPAGGAKAFEFPSAEGGEAVDYVSSFEGVILDSKFVNAYWDHPFGEGDKTPNCASMDGISGYDTDGLEHNCKTCPHNMMGSRDGGRGKACRNMAQLLILVEGEPLPIELRVPVMSVKNYAQYIARVLSPRGLQPWQVATKFSLMKATNGGGIDYSQIMFQCGGRIPDDEIEALRGAVTPMLDATMQGALEAGEENGNADSDKN